MATLVALGIMLLDKSSRAPDQEQSHEVTPVVGLLALPERAERLRIAIAHTLYKFRKAASCTDRCVWPNGQCRIIRNKKSDLIGEVGNVNVVWGCSEQHDIWFIL